MSSPLGLLPFENMSSRHGHVAGLRDKMPDPWRSVDPWSSYAGKGPRATPEAPCVSRQAGKSTGLTTNMDGPGELSSEQHFRLALLDVVVQGSGSRHVVASTASALARIDDSSVDATLRLAEDLKADAREVFGKEAGIGEIVKTLKSGGFPELGSACSQQHRLRRKAAHPMTDIRTQVRSALQVCQDKARAEQIAKPSQGTTDTKCAQYVFADSGNLSSTSSGNERECDDLAQPARALLARILEGQNSIHNRLNDLTYAICKGAAPQADTPCSVMDEFLQWRATHLLGTVDVDDEDGMLTLGVVSKPVSEVTGVWTPLQDETIVLEQYDNASTVEACTALDASTEKMVEGVCEEIVDMMENHKEAMDSSQSQIDKRFARLEELASSVYQQQQQQIEEAKLKRLSDRLDAHMKRVSFGDTETLEIDAKIEKKEDVRRWREVFEIAGDDEEPDERGFTVAGRWKWVYDE